MDRRRVDVKPLSVNRAWQGKRYRTPEYKAYQKEVLLKLRALDIPNGELEAYYTFGVSSKLSDWDNPVKPFQDILQAKHGFDDRRIVRAVVEKVLVPKGEEFIEYSIVSRET